MSRLQDKVAIITGGAGVSALQQRTSSSRKERKSCSSTWTKVHWLKPPANWVMPPHGVPPTLLIPRTPSHTLAPPSMPSAVSTS